MQSSTSTIPKIIHYCWFGGKPLPPSLQECMDSWKLLDDYQVMRWDESNCSFDENEFVRRTFREKKLGFIGDYYRLKAVYEYGGIYLDTDVKVYKRFDDLMGHPLFLNFIFDSSIGSAIIGAQPKSPFIKGLLDMYDATIFGENEGHKPLCWQNGVLVADGYVTSNYYYTHYILSHYPGFLLNNTFQDMGDFVIYPKELFEIGTLSKKHYTIHLCAGEWRMDKDTGTSAKARAKQMIRKWPWLFDKVQIVVRKRRYRKQNRELPFYPYQRAQMEKTALPKL